MAENYIHRKLLCQTIKNRQFLDRWIIQFNTFIPAEKLNHNSFTGRERCTCNFFRSTACVCALWYCSEHRILKTCTHVVTTVAYIDLFIYYTQPLSHTQLMRALHTIDRITR